MKKLNIFFLSFFAFFIYFGILNLIVAKTENLFLSQRAGIIYSSKPFLIEEKSNQEIINNFEINAKAAFSLKVETNGKEKIIYSKNEDLPLPIASLTKLMTAFIVFELKETYNPFQIITLSREAALQKGISVLNTGDRVTVNDLIHISLIESSNDAAFSLAEMIGEKNFIELMNFFAKKRMGFKNTNFLNPTGLNNFSENISTAREIAFLVKKIKDNYPEILEITTKKEYNILRENGTIYHTSKNTNLLLSDFPEIIGGKTGWTLTAKECLVIVIERDDGYIINVILGSDNRFEEMKKILKNI